MTRLRLRDDVWLQPVYDDSTRFGSVVSGAMEARLKQRFADLVAPLRASHWQRMDHDGLFAAVRSAAPDLFVDERTLHPEFLHPDARAVRPTSLTVHTSQGVLGALPLTADQAGRLADAVGAWQAGNVGPAPALFDAMQRLGAFTDAAPLPALPMPEGADVVAVGHACVGIASPRRRVLVDPFLPAHDAAAAYRPLALSQLAPDVVLLTHSHPDHYDPGTLLRLGADCDIVVPDVDRESALTVDMAMRLEQLGFRRVHRLAWHGCLRFDDVEVRALPFHGEQAGDGERLHPACRNVGNVYTVQTPSRRIALTADAGRDADGDLVRVAAADRQHAGAVDLVFAGCRAWALYPAQLLCSSIRRHALFVARREWARRHQLMSGPHEAIDAAEAWGARSVVPYADGGAPWYWSIGLGLDLSRPAAGGGHFETRPEALAQAAAARSSWGASPIASPVRVQVLRPGETLSQGPAGPAQHWPFAAAAGTPPAVESEAALRKKTLLRVLALELAATRGLQVEQREVQAFSEHLRRDVGLVRRDDMLQFLAGAGLTADGFAQLMREWAHCNAFEELFAAEIDSRLPSQRALHAMRHATARSAA